MQICECWKTLEQAVIEVDAQPLRLLHAFVHAYIRQGGSMVASQIDVLQSRADCQSPGGLPPGMALGCGLTYARGDRGENYKKITAGLPITYKEKIYMKGRGGI
jgi:hypothetical protein